MSKKGAAAAPRYRREQMVDLVAATRRVAETGTSFDGAWMQGMQCWGETLIAGWPGDDGFATREAEAHGDTLCIGLEQRGRWMVIEIDEPVGFDPVKVSLLDAKEVRQYFPESWEPGRGWARGQATVYKRKGGRAF